MSHKNQTNQANIDLRNRYLNKCLTEHMSPVNLHLREVTTEHILEAAGCQSLLAMGYAPLGELLSGLRHQTNGTPLSDERLRKIFNHVREMLMVAYDDALDALKVARTNGKVTSPPNGRGLSWRELDNLTLSKFREWQSQPNGAQSTAHAARTVAAHSMHGDDRQYTPQRDNQRGYSPPGEGHADHRQAVYTLEEIQKVAACAVGSNRILQRAQACFVLQFLCGLRATPVVHLDLDDISIAADKRTGCVRQPVIDGRESQTAQTAQLSRQSIIRFLNFPEMIGVIDLWCTFLRESVPSDAKVALRGASSQTKVFAVLDGAQCPIPAARVGRNRHTALSDDFEEICDRAGVPAKGSEAVRRAHDQLYAAYALRGPIRVDEWPASYKHSLRGVLPALREVLQESTSATSERTSERTSG